MLTWSARKLFFFGTMDLAHTQNDNSYQWWLNQSGIRMTLLKLLSRVWNFKSLTEYEPQPEWPPRWSVQPSAGSFQCSVGEDAEKNRHVWNNSKSFHKGSTCIEGDDIFFFLCLASHIKQSTKLTSDAFCQNESEICNIACKQRLMVILKKEKREKEVFHLLQLMTFLRADHCTRYIRVEVAEVKYSSPALG